ncbi:MAG: diaminopimelate decarboxylase [Candidatus Competibacterales bacterium]
MTPATPNFAQRDGQLAAENVPLTAIAEAVGTPCYVYSKAALENHWRAFDGAFGPHPHLVCYAVKANGNLGVLSVLARLGSGFDIVSQGELERVLAAGGDPDQVVFSGVGKTRDEIQRALEVGIRCFNAESKAELERIDEVARAMGKVAPVSLRVNPDVDAETHPYIATGLKENKFGIDIPSALAIYRWAAHRPSLRVCGVDCHIGSQLLSLTPFLAALERVLALVAELETSGISLEHIDVGGGLGIAYRDEESPPDPGAQVRALCQALQGAGQAQLEVWLEPGRAISGPAGVLLTRVEYLKENPAKRFAVVDAAMNDLLRPALYGAYQRIEAVVPRPGEALTYDVVGPVCETGDFLGKDRPLCLAVGDLLAVRDAGAYGFAMSSNYNTRPRAPEVLVDGDRFHVVRRRETIAQLLADESPLP